ncbi:MAG: PKD domain-containing protein [Methanospirillum sp.]|uniref:PKD domain-containing protein n=1 Tax=Methanospirillum sp. TaxID=45200 RepID=UPI00236FD594|nr:PKD domain-containing protein [Methanospirillum sp.]MDD1730160.1 PKD domain-containing protein [Methanospirillum sp.]
MKKDSGISEVLGAVLMIAIMVTGFSILGTVYFSQPPPEKIPQVSFNLVLGTDNQINLIHAGGDSLRTYDSSGNNAEANAEYYILVDREKIWPILDATATLDSGKSEFSYVGNTSSTGLDMEYLQVGEGFSAKPLSLPKNIDIIYKSPSGAESIIWSGLIPRIIDFGTGGSIFGSGSGRVGMTGSVRVCINEEVQFNDTSYGNVVYSDWDFDANKNPGIDATGLTPTWTYTETGLYSVTHNITTDEGLNFTLTKENYIEVKPVHADFTESWDKDCTSSEGRVCDLCNAKYPGKPCGREPFLVNFTDGSYCSPTGWSWNLGDGTVKSGTSVSNYYLYDYGRGDGTEPILYSVELTASNPGGSDRMNKTDLVVVYPLCTAPKADFSYDGVVDLDGNMSVEFTDLSTSDPESVVYWDWDFDNGKEHYYGKEPPRQEFEARNETYKVKLIVKNDCGQVANITRPIVFPCTTLTGVMDAEPKTGESPLTVNFTDHSEPHANITGWRWSFGDGTYYYSSNVSNPNPPPHTYDRVGTFYASLMVQNECGQAFVNTSVFVVSKPGLISGKVWTDKNQNRVKDTSEDYLPDWQVTLEERKSGTWQAVNSTTTNSTGDYVFYLEGVSNSVFRVREYLPDKWKVTYSYGTYNQNVSDSILIYSDREYTNIDFGNVGPHTSSIQVPGYFVKYGGGYSDGTFYYSDLASSAEFLDYNTTYNTTPRVVYLSPSSRSGTFTLDPPGGYPTGYTTWGDSSYNLTFREYNNYLKYEGYGAYFLDWWQYPVGTNYVKGIHFPVPDNTTISANQLYLTYKWDSSIHFDIDKPKEGDTIPYTSAYTVEAHFEGLGERTSQCYLTSPVSTQQLLYNSTIAEYLITSLDTRPYEGTKRLFTARMKLSNGTYVYAYSNATIAYEPITVNITSITSESGTWTTANPNVKGNTTVTASVSGKWQDNTSAQLYVNNQSVGTMAVTTPGLPSTVQGTFNAEQYAGRTLPVFVRVPYRNATVIAMMGNFADSPLKSITVLSKEPIHANFTAYPWTGRAPHEVAFTDLSTGGANQWSWNFKDGNSSTEQNPIHIFMSEGNYSVRQMVTNATPASDYIEKYVNVTGIWNGTSLLTSRNTILESGGVMSWISRGSNSTITVNNTTITMADGDSIEIALRNQHSKAKIFMAGSITECNLSDIDLKINGIQKAQGNITQIRVQDFENFHSNLTLTAAKNYAAWVSFQWQGTGVSVSWKRNLRITELMPTIERFMSLELDSDQSFFDGTAAEYYFT